VSAKVPYRVYGGRGNILPILRSELYEYILWYTDMREEERLELNSTRVW
jgi:hypothetical protein